MSNVFKRERLTERRKQLGWSLDQLSKEVSITKSYIWELENKPERKPSVDTVFKLAKALGVSMEWLCGDSMNGDQGAAYIGAQVLKIVRDVTPLDPK